MTSGQDEAKCLPISPHWLESAVRQNYQIKKNQEVVHCYWDKVHQRAFDHVKGTIAKEVVLVYLDYSKVIEIYTESSSKQLVLYSFFVL